MPTEFITTDGSANPITLSAKEVYGHLISTVIMINHAVFASINGDFEDYVLGTNKSLAGNTVTVTTTSLKVTPSNNTEVDYVLKGAGVDVQDNDLLQFPAGVSVDPHFMTYYF